MTPEQLRTAEAAIAMQAARFALRGAQRPALAKTPQLRLQPGFAPVLARAQAALAQLEAGSDEPVAWQIARRCEEVTQSPEASAAVS